MSMRDRVDPDPKGFELLASEVVFEVQWSCGHLSWFSWLSRTSYVVWFCLCVCLWMGGLGCWGCVSRFGWVGFCGCLWRCVCWWLYVCFVAFVCFALGRSTIQILWLLSWGQIESHEYIQPIIISFVLVQVMTSWQKVLLLFVLSSLSLLMLLFKLLCLSIIISLLVLVEGTYSISMCY